MIDAVMAHRIDEAAAVNHRSVDEEIATGRWNNDEWFARRHKSDPQIRELYESGKKVLASHDVIFDDLAYVDGELQRWEDGRYVRFDVNRPAGRRIVIGYNRFTMRYGMASFIPQPRLQGENHAKV